MKVIFGEKTLGLNQKHFTTMQTYGSIGKGIFKHDTKHQISISKRYISEEVKRGHSRNKTVTEHFCHRQNRQNKQYLWNPRATT